MPEVIKDVPLHERGALFDITDDELGEATVPGSPLRFHGSPRPIWRPNPKIGEHTEEILADWLGLSHDETMALKATGSVA